MRIPKRVTLALFMLVAEGTFIPCQAQTLFTFYNTASTPVFHASGQRLFGSNYVAVLYGGMTSDNLTEIARDASFPARARFNRTLSGLGGYFISDTEALAEFYTLPAFTDLWLQVRVYDEHVAQRYEEALSLGYGYGQSEPFLGRGGDLLVDGSLPGDLRNMKSFSIHDVPEPGGSILILAGFGLWAIRRVQVVTVR